MLSRSSLLLSKISAILIMAQVLSFAVFGLVTFIIANVKALRLFAGRIFLFYAVFNVRLVCEV